ncbi:MAG: hypothetical protein H7234_02540 [Herminiimonas sp.]|nr:hypothetical protein [Herminiimonas sp.]
MKITPAFSKTLIAAACTAAVLSACGGGGGGGTAVVPPTADAPPALLGTSTVSGTLTGFGSIIVDGIRIDNHAVAAGREIEDGSMRPVELKLGQHVEVEHDGTLVASKIVVGSEVEGTITAVDVTAGTLTVLGQIVVINTDAALGPVTVFEAPYTRLADVKSGDGVEIHALLKTDAAGKVSLQATRVEKKIADEADRARGLVSELSLTAHTFRLGNLLVDYSGARLLPAGVALTNGAEVQVALPSATTAGSTAVKATVVKVKDRKGESQGKQVELGGAIAVLDVVAKTITVNGIKVDLSSASFNQSGRGLADLKAGSYVVIKGTYGSDSTLKATTVVIRGVDQDKGNEVELHGTTADFKASDDFKIRGVPVDASHATIDLASCLSAKLANDLQVSATGSLTASGKVILTSIKCEKAQDGQTVVEREGVTSRVETVAKTFTLTTSVEALAVQWSTATTFVDVDAATLAGKRVKVEGTVSAGVLRAEKIALKK